MKIVIDFDGTLFPTVEQVVELYNERYNESLQFSQITTYNFYECLPAPVADKLVDLFCDEEVYDSIQPYKGSIKAVQTLANKGHEIFIATATCTENLGWKERLLERYFPFIPKDNLIRIHNKKLLNVDVMIEDNLHHLKETHADRICFDHLWNQSERADYVYDIKRMHHWCEVVNIIKNIERKNEEWEKE